ncbi:hypothetical protein [Piscinibacter sp.]|uniref:hypothetical protein n=1 Tax=Piscinibacter sp. TaxID=1903157 RepID=UPI002CBB1331|nr:hypothetical protein [Albitalea sp.]HUG24570.1 hypothetical protein [Albitalea sp.]
MTDSELMRSGDGSVESSEGWVARLLSPELIEYSSGCAACLVNVSYSPAQRARQIYATESTSELFPRLREHLRSAAPLFEGRYVVV